MKQLLFGMLFAVGSAFAADEATVAITNVRMTQDLGTRRVTVTYDLSIQNPVGSASPLTGVLIRLDVLTNSPSGYVSIGRDRIKTVTGDYSISANSAGTKGLVTAGTDKTLVWDAKRDFPGQRLDDVKVAVRAYQPGELVFDEWKYFLIEIGTNNDQTSKYNWALTDQTPDVYNVSAANSWMVTASQIWFVRCPAGSFMMGAPEGSVHYQTGRPLHKVTLTQPFFMEITPMSNHQWSRVVEYKLAANANAHAGASIDLLMGANWYSTRVIDPSSVVGKIRARSGLNVTLPTEAQWEYACRAGSKGTFTGTDEFFTTTDARDAYYKNTFGVNFKTINLGTSWNTLTNAWGIAGMHTSIATFCQDTQDAVTADDAVNPCTRGSSAGFVVRGPWQWGGGATCHDYPANGGIGHSFGDSSTGARLVVMP